MNELLLRRFCDSIYRTHLDIGFLTKLIYFGVAFFILLFLLYVDYKHVNILGYKHIFLTDKNKC